MTQQALAVDGKEIWESTIPGRIAVMVLDERGQERTQTILGKGQRLRVTAFERQLNEERIIDEQNNPFTNGMLVHINRPEADDSEEEAPKASDNELSDEQLGEVFALDTEDFEATVKTLTEVNVRRLKDMAPTVDAKASQIAFLNEYIQETWPIGGDTPTYREMQVTPQ